MISVSILLSCNASRPSQTLSRIVCNVQTDSVMNLSVNPLKPKQSISVLLCEWYMGLPRWCTSNRSACQCKTYKRRSFNPWVREIPLEQEMATHPSILAWEIPWTEELGRLQSMQSQRIGHDGANEHTAHTHVSHIASMAWLLHLCQVDWV